MCVCVSLCMCVCAEDMAEMKARQQQQASHIFKVQQKQMEPAYIDQLESYIVSTQYTTALAQVHHTPCTARDASLYSATVHKTGVRDASYHAVAL